MNIQIKRLYIMIMLTSLTSFFSSSDAAVPGEGKKASAPKIAYVNTHELITIDKKLVDKAVDEWRELFKKIESTMAPAEKEIKDLQDKFEKGKSDFESLQKSGVASEDALRKKYQDVSQVEVTFRKRYYDLEQFYQVEINKAQATVAPKIEKAIKELRKSQGWDMVIDGKTVIDADNNFNLTNDVKVKVNKVYQDEKKAKEQAQKTAQK